jgi:predicted nucleotidyltransferase
MFNIESKIIQLLSDYPEREFYGQEIAKKTKCSKASVSLIMKKLVQKKLVSKIVRGQMNFYQINLKSPDIKKFKINSVLEKINPLLPKLEGLSRKIILFGSGSRGDQTWNSDIDLFILSNEKIELRSVLSELKLDLPIKAVIKTQSEWSEMELNEPELYGEIKNGITLYEYVPRI